MISVGPYPIGVVVVFFAIIVAWLVIRRLARHMPNTGSRVASGLFFDAVLVGLIAARCVFILIWWKDYAATPLSMLAVGDGGFNGPAGVLSALAWIGWKTRSQQPLRKPIYIGVVAGLVAWGAATGVPVLLQSAVPSLPSLQLSTIDHSQSVELRSFIGRPVVVNLWATWCPPCRREMPVLEQAQSHYPDIAFVLINQGEGSQTIQTFLDAEGLELEHVLLDPFSSAMREVGSRGLPTTLFFNAEGRMVDSHLGELTMPALKSIVKRHFE